MLPYGNVKLPEAAPVRNFMLEDEEDESEMVVGGAPSPRQHPPAPREEGERAPSAEAVSAPSTPARTPVPSSERRESAKRSHASTVSNSAATKRTRNRVKTLSGADLEVLQFVAYCRFTTVKQVAANFQRSSKQVLRQLTRLKSGLWLMDESGPGRMALWRLDAFGHQTLLDFGLINSFTVPARMKISDTRVRHQLLVNHVMSLALTGSEQGLKGGPFKGIAAKPLSLDEVVTEYGMRSDFSTRVESLKQEKKSRGESPSMVAHEVAKQYREDGKVLAQPPGKFVLTPLPGSARARTADERHIPDLVFDRGRSSLLVEVEVAAKTSHELQKIMRVYQEAQESYGRVVWFVEAGAPTAKHLEAALRAVAPTPEECLLETGKAFILPLRKHDGTVAGRFDLV